MYIADLMLDSLDRFPKKERQKRLKDIHRILTSSNRGRRSKRLSTCENHHEPLLAAVQR